MVQVFPGKNKQKSVLKLHSDISTNLSVRACRRACAPAGLCGTLRTGSLPNAHMCTLVKIIREERHPGLYSQAK